MESDELKAIVLRLRGLLDAVRLTVPADAINENLRLNIQRALADTEHLVANG